MKQYLELMQRILDEGVQKKDRTGTGTRSIHGVQLTHDLSEGFPAVTTKKLWFKGVVEEFLWMVVRGSTDVKELEDRGVGIWSNWRGDDGDIGPGYGKQFRHHTPAQKFVRVEPRVVKTAKRVTKHFSLIDPEERGEDALIGETLPSKSHGEFRVLRSYRKGGRSMVDVQFLDTGYVAKEVRRERVQEGGIKDRYAPSVWGVGHMGDMLLDKSVPIQAHFYSIWQSMLERCYNPSHPAYENYGGDGIFVCNRWLNFTNFFNDLKRLPNWHLKKNDWDGYQLDKDYYSSNCYSPKTCVWLSKAHNVLYRGDTRKFVATMPSGQKVERINRYAFARNHDLNPANIWHVLQGNRQTHKGYRFEYASEDTNWRYALPYDQVESVIEGLKNNPQSRRHIISLWNGPEMNLTTLPCCHGNIVQFLTRPRPMSRVATEVKATGGSCDGEKLVVESAKKRGIPTHVLDCIMHQRSADWLLGVPWNIAFYAIFTHVVSQLTNMTPGTLTMNFGDAHLYNNHLDKAREQLSREPHALCELVLNSGIRNIDDFTFDDIELVGYEHHPAIKAEVAV